MARIPATHTLSFLQGATALLIALAAFGCASTGGKQEKQDAGVTADSMPDTAEIPPELLALANPANGVKPAPTAPVKAAEPAAEAPVAEEAPPAVQEDPQTVAAEEATPAPAKRKKHRSVPEDAEGDGEGTSACSQAGPDGTITYRIKPGDSLMRVAFETTGDLKRWREIQRDNSGSLANIKALRKGGLLKINCADYVIVHRNGKAYLIRRHDTLIKISKKLYGTPFKWRKLWKNNPEMITDPNLIYAGFRLHYVRTKQEDDYLKMMLERETAPRTPASAPALVTPPVATPVDVSAAH
jgi:nucleoid-associated protein YgaU